MNAMGSQITSLTIVYLIFYSGANQRKYQSSAQLAFVRGIHRGSVNSLYKGPVTRKMFSFDDVIMYWCIHAQICSDRYWHLSLHTANPNGKTHACSTLSFWRFKSFRLRNFANFILLIETLPLEITNIVSIECGYTTCLVELKCYLRSKNN